MLLFGGYVYADDVQLKESADDVENNGEANDPLSGSIKRPQSLKSPRPSVVIRGNIIFFKKTCKNCTLYVYNEDGDLEYMTAIPDGTVTFALHFSGEYKVVVTDGLFYCEKNVSL
jgi:hypothetical protein